MAVRVELDVFSGRPNPYSEMKSRDAQMLIDAYLDASIAAAAPEAAPARLGYRGFVVTLSGQHARLAKGKGRREEFRVVGTDSLAGSGELRSYLSEVAVADGHVRSAEVASEVEGAVVEAEGCGCAEDAAGTVGDVVPLATCTHYLWQTPSAFNTEYMYWNASPYLESNNCYNFASRYRTGTFAQPGRGSGSMFGSFSVSSVKSAAVRDGYSTSCSGTSIAVALVIWPGQDFHWYRHTAAINGKTAWSHKPGRTLARYADNSGKQITSPSSCDRGNYTDWGGYLYYAGKSNPKVK